MESILLITTESPSESLHWIRQRYAHGSVSLLSFAADVQDGPLPDRWQWLRVADLLDEQALCCDFLEFLDAWPRQPLFGGRSFDQMFRRPGGYSVWSTGPDADQIWSRGVFSKLKMIWICDRAIKAYAPQRVLIHTRQQDLAWSLASRCQREEREYGFVPGSARETRSPWAGCLVWLGRSLFGLFWWPLYVLVRAMFARLLATTPSEERSQREIPAVVIASAFYPYFRVERGRVISDYWREFSGALARFAPEKRQRFLLRMPANTKFKRYRGVCRLYHTGWRLLRRLDGAAAPIAERHLAFGAWLRSVPGQLATLLRYVRLEQTFAFRTSFVFAGADVSSLYVPSLRHSLAGLSKWAQTVGAIGQSLRAIGTVEAMLVAEEVFHAGMLDIAAARELGIPTIGVQHGVIMPTHLIYRLPPGRVESAPIPDFFAAYGEYAKETLSVHGAFPAEQVWITGGSRFDHLVNDPPNASTARERLGLPQDKRIVLIATQHYPWFQKAAKVIFEATKGNPDCCVCVKTHPRDVSLDVYRRIAQQVGAGNVLFFGERFDELLAACDVLIGASSTTVLEAVLLGRRAICINFTDEPDWYPYVQDGGSLGARSEKQLRAALDRVFSQEAQPELEAGRQRFLKRHVGPSAQGRAADTLAQMVVSLCSGGTEKAD